VLKNAGQVASLYHHSAVDRLAQESLVDELNIFFHPYWNEDSTKNKPWFRSPWSRALYIVSLVKIWPLEIKSCIL